MGGAQKPVTSGTKKGQLEKTTGNTAGGGSQTKYWEWDGKKWKEIDKQLYDAGGSEAPYNDKSTLTVGPYKPPTNNKKSYIRWPDAMVTSSSDYIYFEFGKYVPPFSNDASNSAPSGSSGIDAYNASATAFKPESINGVAGILLPMPQDLSTESRQEWQGKSFTRIGKSAVAALAAGNPRPGVNTAKDVMGNLEAMMAAITSSGLNKLPGVGGNLTLSDITGSTRGVVLNPNAEVLYDSPNLREIGMTFKLVASNPTESDTIHKICQVFRRASSPSYGKVDDPGSNFGYGGEVSQEKVKEVFGSDNFIHVPKLCKFTFMSGSKAHKYIAQYKPCAIIRVQVNYTPDGTYASYSGTTAPVAVELALGFLESKLIYSSEISTGLGGTF